MEKQDFSRIKGGMVYFRINKQRRFFNIKLFVVKDLFSGVHLEQIVFLLLPKRKSPDVWLKFLARNRFY